MKGNTGANIVRGASSSPSANIPEGPSIPEGIFGLYKYIKERIVSHSLTLMMPPGIA
jgi:hypothetical protein